MNTNTLIRLATTSEDYEAVFRLRYDVFVKELGISSLDRKLNMVQDYLDETARIVIVQESNTMRILGSVRANFLREGDIDIIDNQLFKRNYPHLFPHAISSTSKLVLSPDCRKTVIIGSMLRYIFELGIEENIKLDFCLCWQHHFGFYGRMGYQQFGESFQSDTYGILYPMLLNLEDTSHIEKIGSIFNKTLSRA